MRAEDGYLYFRGAEANASHQASIWPFDAEVRRGNGWVESTYIRVGGTEWAEEGYEYRTKDTPAARRYFGLDPRADAVAEGMKMSSENKEAIDHPAHYGGDTMYEAIKVIEAWQLGFCLGNAVKYIARAGRKNPAKTIEDLKKAEWYLRREIERREKEGSQ